MSKTNDEIVAEFEQEVRMAMIDAKSNPRTPKSTFYYQTIEKLRTILATKDRDVAMDKAEEIWQNLEGAILHDKEKKFPIFTGVQWSQLKKYLYKDTHENVRDFIPQVESVKIAVNKAESELKNKHNMEVMYIFQAIAYHMSHPTTKGFDRTDLELLAAKYGVTLNTNN